MSKLDIPSAALKIKGFMRFIYHRGRMREEIRRQYSRFYNGSARRHFYLFHRTGEVRVSFRPSTTLAMTRFVSVQNIDRERRPTNDDAHQCRRRLTSSQRFLVNLLRFCSMTAVNFYLMSLQENRLEVVSSSCSCSEYPLCFLPAFWFPPREIPTPNLFCETEVDVVHCVYRAIEYPR